MTDMTRIVTLIWFVGGGMPVQLQGQVPAFDEYQVKAAFLYNFAKFVDWPASTFASASDPIDICILGQNPFGSTLETMVLGKKIGDRPFTVRTVTDIQLARHCQILFIGAGEWKRTRALLDALKGASVLTVGETDDFTAAGGVIAFQLEGPRVRIQIALEPAERAKLRISSKLLRLADIAKRQP